MQDMPQPYQGKGVHRENIMNSLQTQSSLLNYEKQCGDILNFLLQL